MMSKRPESSILQLFKEKPLVKVCAPMVRYSKLQFRNLVKQYDCDLTFTPMILADSFCKSEKARHNELTSNSLDTPLIVQFASNKVSEFVGASYMVSPYCDGVDLNCGCPQRWAKEQNLGCELLKSPQIIFELVRECRNRINKPFTVSVKTRIQYNSRNNVELCKQLENCGVSFLTIHARTIDNNTGPIDNETLKLLVENVNIPVIGNGGVTSLKQCYEMQESTKVKGVMVANGLLSNPTLFTGQNVTSLDCVQKWVDICYNSTLKPKEFCELKLQDLENSRVNIPERPFNLYFQCFHHHLVFMLEKILNKKQRQVFNSLKTFKDSLEFLEQNLGITPKLFSDEQYEKSILVDLDYSNKDILYNELSHICDNGEFISKYDSNKTKGKLFESKLSNCNNSDCNWSDIFSENG